MRFFIPKDFVSLQIVMGLKGKSVEELIAMVLDEIRQKGYSSVRPFSIGKVEERMILYAQANAITLASDELYMSAKQLQHCMRTSKATKGLVVENIELISFPSNRFQMDLYYDGECFIYTNAQSKFIVHPNYKMKISRELVAQVNFITAAHRGSTWLLLSHCKDTNKRANYKINRDLFLVSSESIFEILFQR